MDTSQSQGEAYKIVGSVYQIPLCNIYVDPVFNCRGVFTASQVFSLAQDIKDNGQMVPLVIQPMDDVPTEEMPDPCHWKFRLVAGHRRYMAVDVWTNIDTVNCTIECGLSRMRAHALNFTENLQRKDLNLLEEAQGLLNTWGTEPIRDVARWVKQSKRWVQIRRDLLTMPEYVQTKAAAGRLDADDIEILSQVAPEQIEGVYQKIITSKGKKRKKTRLPAYKKRATRTRTKTEANRTIVFLSKYYELALTPRERDIIQSTIAWMARGINSKEFLEERLDFPEDCVTIDDEDKITGIKDE